MSALTRHLHGSRQSRPVSVPTTHSVSSVSPMASRDERQDHVNATSSYCGQDTLNMPSPANTIAEWESKTGLFTRAASSPGSAHTSKNLTGLRTHATDIAPIDIASTALPPTVNDQGQIPNSFPVLGREYTTQMFQTKSGETRSFFPPGRDGPTRHEKDRAKKRLPAETSPALVSGSTSEDHSTVYPSFDSNEAKKFLAREWAKDGRSWSVYSPK